MTGVDPVQAVVDQLAETGAKVRRQRDGVSYMAQCPAHEDRNPSLSIGPGRDGKALLHCHAGCATDDVLAALGRNVVSLFPDDGERPPVADLHSWPGYRKAVGELVAPTAPPKTKAPAKTDLTATDVYVYDDAAGAAVMRVVRYEERGADGEVVGKTFRQQAADGQGGWKGGLDGLEPPLYHLPAVLAAVAARLPVLVVEGEKDADAAVSLGFVGTCNPMGAGKWRTQHTAALAGGTVMLVPDRDGAGVAHAITVRDALLLAGCTVTVYGAADGKDLTEHLAAGGSVATLLPVDLDDADDWLAGRAEVEAQRTSWWPRDLAAVISGAQDEPGPTHLYRADGQPLFYSGKVNGLLGESESGKTWVALLAVAEALRAGQSVLYLDFEDTAPGIVGRLRALGVADTQLGNLHYIGPEESLHLAAGNDLQEALERHSPQLVVLDGFNAAMTLLGLDLDNNKDATKFAQVLLRPLANTGACVVYVDHVPKNKEARGKGGIGAQAKRAMTTGCALAVDVLAPFGRGMTGRLKLTVDKDRPGHVRAVCAEAKHVGVAVLVSDPATLAVTVRIEHGGGEDEPSGDVKLMDRMERLSHWAQMQPETFTKRAARAAVRGGNDDIDEALAELVERGYVTLDSAGYSHVTAYSIADDLASTTPRAERAARAESVPSARPAHGAGVPFARAAVPPTLGGGTGHGTESGAAAALYDPITGEVLGTDGDPL